MAGGKNAQQQHMRSAARIEKPYNAHMRLFCNHGWAHLARAPEENGEIERRRADGDKETVAAWRK